MCWYESNRAGMCCAAQGKYCGDKGIPTLQERQQIAESEKFKKSDKSKLSIFSNLRFSAFQNRKVEMETFVPLGTRSELEEIRNEAHQTIKKVGQANEPFSK
jgi:hypothetical protein